MKIKNQKSKIKITYQNLKILNFGLSFCILIFAFCILLLGCDAFVRKFTRKPKKEQPVEEIVLVPQVYPALFENKEAAYRQYFLYWQSWQDELINALLVGTSQKKQLSCVDEAIKNLMQVKNLLVEQKQKELDSYITELNALRSNIEEDPYANTANRNRSVAEQLKRNILRDFSYIKIKNSLR